jgi:hypothetical protein
MLLCRARCASGACSCFEFILTRIVRDDEDHAIRGQVRSIWIHSQTPLYGNQCALLTPTHFSLSALTDVCRCRWTKKSRWFTFIITEATFTMSALLKKVFFDHGNASHFSCCTLCWVHVMRNEVKLLCMHRDDRFGKLFSEHVVFIT